MLREKGMRLAEMLGVHTPYDESLGASWVADMRSVGWMNGVLTAHEMGHAWASLRDKCSSAGFR